MKCAICLESDNGYQTVTVDTDGSPAFAGAILYGKYQSYKKVERLLKLGDLFELHEELNPVPNLSMLKIQRKNALKQIDEHQKAIEECKAELKRIETDLFVYSNKEFEKIYADRGVELTKKDLIIEYYIRGIPQEKIAEAVGVSNNYVSKVLSTYRKEKGIVGGKKGQKTKTRIMQCLSSGMSINQTAYAVEVTPQYVNAVRREFESNRMS